MKRLTVSNKQVGHANGRRSASSLTRALKSSIERRAFINQPIDEVVRHLEKTSCCGARITGADDPTFRRTYRLLRRRIEVRYTLYAIPGGMQISAFAPRAQARSLDPWSNLASRAVLRKVTASLNRVRAHLE